MSKNLKGWWRRCCDGTSGRRSRPSRQQGRRLRRFAQVLRRCHDSVRLLVQVGALQIHLGSQLDFLQREAASVYVLVARRIKRDEEIPGNPWCRWGRSWWRRRPGSIQTPCWRCEPCSPAKTTDGSERCNATKKVKGGNTKSPLTFSPGVQCSLRGRSTSRTVVYKMTDDTNTDRRGRC